MIYFVFMIICRSECAPIYYHMAIHLHITVRKGEDIGHVNYTVTQSVIKMLSENSGYFY